MPRFVNLERNARGKDFVVGDIHGCFDLLDAALERLDFDRSADRLFSVGDLIDRGPRSERAAEFLAAPWFFAVRGNHEDMLLDVVGGRVDETLHRDNGGGWFYRLDFAAQRRFTIAVETMPHAIEIDAPCGSIGIVHAECPLPSWPDFVQELTRPEPPPSILEAATWSRTRIESGDRTPVAGIDRIVVGHTPLDATLSLGNTLYLDTGAVFSGRLSFMELSSGTVATPAVGRR